MFRDFQVGNVYKHRGHPDPVPKDIPYQLPHPVGDTSIESMKGLILLLLAAAAGAKPTVYWIRHGEKPDSGNGLSAQGLQRAQCLRSVFGASSGYYIGHIMAQAYKSGMHTCLHPRDDTD